MRNSGRRVKPHCGPRDERTINPRFPRKPQWPSINHADVAADNAGPLPFWGKILLGALSRIGWFGLGNGGSRWGSRWRVVFLFMLCGRTGTCVSFLDSTGWRSNCRFCVGNGILNLDYVA